MDKLEYPKMIYKPGESLIVKDAAEEESAGEGWSDVPVPAEEEAEKTDESAPEVKSNSKKKGFLR